MITITHWGTTDVDNYGDLVFPLVLEKQMNRRLGQFEVALAAPFGGTFPADDSRPVKRIVRFEEPGFYSQVRGSNAVVLGGGDIIRVDEEDLISLYGTDSEWGYGRFNRLFLHDLGKLARVIPVYWNAVGVPHEFDPSEYREVRRAADHVRYLSVRDELSKNRLESAGVDREIEVVPDTALLLPELLSNDDLCRRIRELRTARAFPDRGQIFTFQMPLLSEDIAVECAGVLVRLKAEFPDLQIVLLPVGNCRNDRSMIQIIRSHLGEAAFIVDRQTSIPDVAAVISHSHCFAGASLHGNITAAAYEVDSVFIDLPECAASKNREFAKMLGRETCLVKDLSQLYLALHSLASGQRPVDVSILSSLKNRLEAHFDRLASDLAAEAGKTPGGCMRQIDRVHGELCESLAAAAAAKAERQRIQLESKLRDAEARAASAIETAERLKDEIDRKDAEILKIRQSPGWRLLSKYGRLKHRLLLPITRRLGL